MDGRKTCRFNVLSFTHKKGSRRVVGRAFSSEFDKAAAKGSHLFSVVDFVRADYFVLPEMRHSVRLMHGGKVDVASTKHEFSDASSLTRRLRHPKSHFVLILC
jgi:hypothetical protein